MNAPILTACLAALVGLASNAAAQGFVVDYRYRPSAANLADFDLSILDPGAVVDLSLAHRAGRRVLAYISVGEIGADASYRREALSQVSVLGTNPDWGSSIVDVSDPAWADFVIGRLAKDASDKGYDGFFLDTVDVLTALAAKHPGKAALYVDGMTLLINRLRAAYPTKKIITNRGFQVYSGVRGSIDGFLLESLFRTWDGSNYVEQDAQETSKLLALLKQVRADGTPVYVLDYSDPDKPNLAAKTAQRIQDEGFLALVSPKGLTGRVLAPSPRWSRLAPLRSPPFRARRASGVMPRDPGRPGPPVDRGR